ncbi:MAG TPA: formate dehydrogenase accessory protein FdhE [bacterium]|nr:formate dehydrogenase accessory protein FdhE [bacterium]
MKDSPGRRERILKGFESLQRVPYVPAEYLSFRLALYRAQIEAYDAIPPGPAPIKPPLKPGSLAPDAAVLARLYQKASESLGENLPVREQLQKLAGNFERLPEVVEAARFGDLKALARLSSETGVEPDALLFFGRAGAAPYASRMVWAGPGTRSESHDEISSCPYCGAAPGLSLLRGETGQRFLVCSVCGMDREFPRLKCPFCAKEGALEIIRENDAPRWIETCGSCRRYLNSTDTRQLGMDAEWIPLLEAIANLYLDLIAEKQGCQRNLPYVAIS